MANIITDGLTKIANDGYENSLKGAAFIKQVFEDNVKDSSNYVYGVVQTESKSKGTSAAVAGVVGYKMYDWADHIVGVDVKNGNVVVLSLDGDNVIHEEMHQKGNFTIKAMSKGFQETIYFITPNFLKSIMGMRQPDMYKRTKYTIDSNGSSVTYLVGNYSPTDHTNYVSYDNTGLFTALKELVKK